jgi:hypothetical protein
VRLGAHARKSDGGRHRGDLRMQRRGDRHAFEDEAFPPRHFPGDDVDDGVDRKRLTGGMGVEVAAQSRANSLDRCGEVVVEKQLSQRSSRSALLDEDAGVGLGIALQQGRCNVKIAVARGDVRGGGA